MFKKLFGLLGVLVIMGAGCASQEVGVPIEDIDGEKAMEADEMMMEDHDAMGHSEPPAAPLPVNPSPDDSVSISNPVIEEDEGVTNVSVSAKRFEFTPSNIIVNKGTTVNLSLTATDVSHGISIPEFGASVKAAAGETESTQFVADREGTFPFRCNVFCGSGHSTMTGTITVQ